MKKQIFAMLTALLLLAVLGAASAEEADSGAWLDVTLYFRYGDTAYLGTEGTRIDLRQEDTVATLIVRRLIEGPQASHDRLSGLFPRDTQVISARTEGDTAYVTLNSAFLGKPDGAPADWEERDAWKKEAALRRRLAFQSIVLALTEDGRCQRVQLYIAEDDDAVPQRLSISWFDPTQENEEIRLAACGRDDSLVITPKLALSLVLQGWQQKDWEAVWPFISHAERGAPESYSVFRQRMEQESAVLLSWQVSAGSVSVSGRNATVVLDGKIRLEDGSVRELTRMAVPLFREEENWVLSAENLLELMGEEEL